MASTSSTRTRHWSDVLALVTGVALIGMVIWPGNPVATNAAAEELRFPIASWMTLVIAGALALGGATIAQRWSRRGAGRAMIALGGVLLLANLLFVRDFGARSLLTLLLPGLALLAAAFGAGPMPRDVGPEYRGTSRSDTPRQRSGSVAERKVNLAQGNGIETRTQRNYGPDAGREDRPSA